MKVFGLVLCFCLFFSPIASRAQAGADYVDTLSISNSLANKLAPKLSGVADGALNNLNVAVDPNPPVDSNSNPRSRNPSSEDSN